MAGNPVRRARGGVPAPGARGYSWEPFRAGNVVALVHGGRSPCVYGPLAEVLATALLERRPDLESFPFEVSAWAVAETRSAIFRAELDRVGMLDEAGVPRQGLLEWAHKCERLAAERRRSLGLDPRSAAELARQTAEAQLSGFDLESVRAAGREALARRTPVVEALDAAAGEEPS